MAIVSNFEDLKAEIKNARQELFAAEKDWATYQKKSHEQFGFFAQVILQDLQKNIFPHCQYQVVSLPEEYPGQGELLEYRLVDTEHCREMVTMAGTVLESINISLYFNKNKLLRGYLCYAMANGEVEETTMCNLSREYLCQAVEGLFEENVDDDEDFEEEDYDEDDFEDDFEDEEMKEFAAPPPREKKSSKEKNTEQTKNGKPVSK